MVRLNVAVQVVSAVSVKGLPQLVGDQPAKVEPAAGVAVKVTVVPLVKPATQVAPQLMPAGVLMTVPEPVPALVTVRGC